MALSLYEPDNRESWPLVVASKWLLVHFEDPFIHNGLIGIF